MRTFKDTAGRDWEIAVNVGSIKRTRDLVKVNLYEVVEVKMALLQRLSTDYEMLANVLFALCKPEADKRGVTDEDFGSSLSGDCLWAGFNALLDDLTDFFPDPRQRMVLKKTIEKIRTVTGMLMTETENRLDAIDPSEVLKELSNSSGSSPASAESAPAT